MAHLPLHPVRDLQLRPVDVATGAISGTLALLFFVWALLVAL